MTQYSQSARPVYICYPLSVLAPWSYGVDRDRPQPTRADGCWAQASYARRGRHKPTPAEARASIATRRGACVIRAKREMLARS